MDKGLRSIAVRKATSVLEGLGRHRRGAKRGVPGTILLFAMYLRRFLKYSLRQVCERLRRQFPRVEFLEYCVSPVVRGRKPAPSRGLQGTVCRPLGPSRGGVSAGRVSVLKDSFTLSLDYSLGRLLTVTKCGIERLRSYDA